MTTEAQPLIKIISRTHDFLKGWHGPLVHPDRPTDRWVVIDGEVFCQRPGAPAFLPVAPPSCGAQLSLDPADEAVIPFLDRRIAESIGLFSGRGSPELTHLQEAGWHLREAVNLLALKRHPRRSQRPEFIAACEVARRVDGPNYPLVRKLLIETLY